MGIRKEQFRKEHDSLGEVLVPADVLWGAQTERSFENFRIGKDRMPIEVIRALAALKLAAANVNARLLPARMTEEKRSAIVAAAEEILSGRLDNSFPLSVFQTGSGTQSNMNVNEVIAHVANDKAGRSLLHPNDDVNMSQSSNDTFPTAMHVSAVLETERSLIPALEGLIASLAALEADNEGVIKSGRTHLEDATPIAFSQEISGWRSSLEVDLGLIRSSLTPLRSLAIGATAVGTGLNAPAGFGDAVAAELSAALGTGFVSAGNKFHALTSKDELVHAHGALKALAADLMKIANDVRLLASGPRCGLGEITIPENEPGSSIMPGKVNPTQCEAVTMVAVEVFGNDVTVGMAASQGNFELNVFMPVLIYDYLRSVRLLADVCVSFEKNCVRGIKANREKMKDYLYNSLMLATALTPRIGYENTARAVRLAHEQDLSLREAVTALGLLSGEEFDEYLRPEKMV